MNEEAYLDMSPGGHLRDEPVREWVVVAGGQDLTVIAQGFIITGGHLVAANRGLFVRGWAPGQWESFHFSKALDERQLVTEP